MLERNEMKRSFFTIALLIGFVASAFAQAPGDASQTIAIPDGKALLVVYRPQRFYGSALKPTIFLDDSKIAKMRNGREFAIPISPGKHAIHSNQKNSGLEFEAEAGRVYYFKIQMSEAGIVQ